MYSRKKRPFEADFEYQFYPNNILILKDLDMGNRSLTNDMENVLLWLEITENIHLSTYKIAYRDSRGIYDRVYFIDSMLHFKSLNMQTEEQVLYHFQINP